MDSALQDSLERLRQGPVEIMFDAGGDDEVAIFVREGLELNLIRAMAEAPTDIVGVVDLFTEEQHGEFELSIPESSMDVLAVLFPETLDGSGYSIPYRGFGRAAGYSMRSSALSLRIRPWQTRNVNTTSIELWKVVPSGDATQSLSKTDPHTFTQPFRALPDYTKEDGELIGRIYLPARS